MFSRLKKKEKVVIQKPVQIRIEECIDMSQTSSQYHIYKDEFVIPFIAMLKKLCVLEENCMKQSEKLEAHKIKQGIEKSQVADGWKELMEQYQQDYYHIVKSLCSEKLLKRGFANSYGKPAEYAYIYTGCQIFFIMKSTKRAIVETHFPHGVDMKHQFIFKNIDGVWLLDEKKYGFDTDWHITGI